MSRDGGYFSVSNGSSLWRTSLLRAAELRDLAARSSGVFCLDPAETEFLAVQQSEPFAPNPALQPTDPPSARRRLRLQSGLPPHARCARMFGAAELDRWAHRRSFSYATVAISL